MTDYRHMHPLEHETESAYAARLERDGFEEVFIRKALVTHFFMDAARFGRFFEDFEIARLRHVKLVFQIHPERTAAEAARQIAETLGLSEARAHYWVERYFEISGGAQGFQTQSADEKTGRDSVAVAAQAF